MEGWEMSDHSSCDGLVVMTRRYVMTGSGAGPQGSSLFDDTAMR
jgi:hypothetical protein